VLSCGVGAAHCALLWGGGRPLCSLVGWGPPTVLSRGVGAAHCALVWGGGRPLCSCMGWGGLFSFRRQGPPTVHLNGARLSQHCALHTRTSYAAWPPHPCSRCLAVTLLTCRQSPFACIHVKRCPHGCQGCAGQCDGRLWAGAMAQAWRLFWGSQHLHLQRCARAASE